MPLVLSWSLLSGTGILLNNQMADFSTPGQLNVFGYPPSPSNFIRWDVAVAKGLRRLPCQDRGAVLDEFVSATALPSPLRAQQCEAWHAGPCCHHNSNP